MEIREEDINIDTDTESLTQELHIEEEILEKYTKHF